MTWKLTMEDLEDSCDRAHNGALSGGLAATEAWGRAERWLDRTDGGVANLRLAVRSLAERWQQASAPTGKAAFLRRRAASPQPSMVVTDRPRVAARIVGLCHLSGDGDEMRLWLDRADVDELAPHLRPALRYLRAAHGDTTTAHQSDAALGPAGLPDLLLAALLDDSAALAAARARVVEHLRAERLRPGSEADVVPLSRYDWLEETFVVEARLSGNAVPSHREMLQRSGLWEPGSRRVVIPVTAPAGWRASITAGGGVASVEVDDDGVEMTVDLMSTASYFRRISVWRPAPEGAYVVQFFGEHPEEPEHEIDADEDFRESISHSVDWLRPHDDLRIEATVMQQILEQLPTTDSPAADAATAARLAPAGWTDEITLASGASAALEVNPSGILAFLTLREPGTPARRVDIARVKPRVHDFALYAGENDREHLVDNSGSPLGFPVGPDFAKALEAIAEYLESPDGPDLTTPATSEAIRALAQRLPA